MAERNMPVCTVNEALNDLRAGKMVILYDDEDPENEGDLTMAAEGTPNRKFNFGKKSNDFVNVFLRRNTN